MQRRLRGVAYVLAALTIASQIPFTSLADEEVGPGIGLEASSETQETATEANTEGETGAAQATDDASAQETGTEANTEESAPLDIEAVIAGSGLDALGEGNTPPDPILNEVNIVGYSMFNAAGQQLSGAVSAHNNYVKSTAGFARLYLEHTGVSRYYYRVFTMKGGWSPWAASTELTPNNDDSSKVQAVQIRFKGYTTTFNDLYYRVVLNDGTVLDWAKNGETTGTIGTDKYIVAMKIALWNKEIEFTQPTEKLMYGDTYEGIYYKEDGSLGYSMADGSAYTGWAYAGEKQYYFKDGALLTGWQYIDGYKYYLNEDGSVARDLEPIMGLTGDYAIRYNKASRTMYIMAKDGANGYIIPYKTFMSSCGPTPIGTFKIYAKYRWKMMHDTIYCQYLNRFKDGFIIHSLIYYDSPNSHTLDADTYNRMDIAISGGCIRLKAGDAAWVYHHCRPGTSVTVYSDVWNKGPVEKEAINQPIPLSQHYDPTDPIIVAQQQAEAAKAAEAAAAAEAQRAAEEAAAAEAQRAAEEAAAAQNAGESEQATEAQ